MSYHQVEILDANWTFYVSWANFINTNATGSNVYYFQAFTNTSDGYAVIVTLRNTTDNDVLVQTYSTGAPSGTLYSGTGDNVTSVKISNAYDDQLQVYVGSEVVYEQAQWTGALPDRYGIGTSDTPSSFIGYFSVGLIDVIGTSADMAIMVPSLIAIVAVVALAGAVSKKVKTN